MSVARRLCAMLGILVAAPLFVVAEETPFNLQVQLDLPPESAALVRAGDTLQMILRPEVQYGARTTPGEPVVAEIRPDAGVAGGPMKFLGAVAPDVIYRLEFWIRRGGAPAERTAARYLSALDRLPRRSIDKALKLRLFVSHPKDKRDNHLLLVRDSDGVYRLLFFTA